jgi:uncharacterized protein YneF (UPF0154 family)
MSSILEEIDLWVVIVIVVILIVCILLFLIGGDSGNGVYVAGGYKKKVLLDAKGIVIDGLNIYYAVSGNIGNKISTSELIQFVDDIYTGLKPKYKCNYHFVFKNREGELISDKDIGLWRKYCSGKSGVYIYIANGEFGNMVGHSVHGRDDFIVLLLGGIDGNIILSNDKFNDIDNMKSIKNFELVKIGDGNVSRIGIDVSKVVLMDRTDIDRKRFTLGML